MGWLHRLTYAIVLFIAFCTPAFADTIYEFTISATGETLAEILRDADTALALPPDASPTPDNPVTYTSTYHTRKQKGIWYFDAAIPFADSVTLTLPQSVHIVQSSPRAMLVKEDMWKLTWENISANITVSYVSTTPIAETTARPVSVPLAPVLLLASIALILYALQKQDSSDASSTHSPSISEGQLNIIRAANPNEALIIKTLLKHNGHIKRNMLERETELGKSSLASSLKNLERKNILTVDRSFFVHYISITSWFKGI